MTTRKMDKQTLDEVMNNMITTVIDSKSQVFDIVEDTRSEYERLRIELEEVKVQVVEKIENTARLDNLVRAARQKLMEVDGDFKRYTESQVKDAYEMAQNIQEQHILSLKEEKVLIHRRNELERRLQTLLEQLRRAELLVARISIILNYLKTDFQQVSQMLEDAKQKQAFGFQLIQAQEEERLKLSREIHDGPAQMLANILMRSDFLIKTYRQRPEEDAIKELRDMKEQVRSALGEVRRIIYDLRPMALDDLGLIPTLSKYLKSLEDYNHISIQFDYCGNNERRLDTKLEVAIFRLIQEAVQNACKHANPSTVIVKIEFLRNKINVLVRDDGVGFNIESGEKENSFGLVGMKERVELLNGDFKIDSKLNFGTTIRITLEIEIDAEQKVEV
ncbi:sensor histidine kinase [Gottfriedia solisilvae]|uniref:Signal transduction histidine-protein kinase/phosphatase DegS n=1 Tax=Gottfriedia solisilvae TaxID=1516104 RepID=A0A8J3ALC7_9BACI|nr:sensor histidine kinase [Gottfriedia solisilvae]GGI16543.1 signal transduction histidine-protein kinase/phosphatase DegS [Gottfriedia solisilvae]